MNVSKLAVIGAGTMGRGIAQRSAMYGYSVVLIDNKAVQLDVAKGAMKHSLYKFVEKGKINENEARKTLANVDMGIDVDKASDCDLVIEAIPENIEQKINLFEELDRICQPGTILASNTSAIPIDSLAKTSGRPEKVMGLHFMNPAPLINLVELIRGSKTLDAVYEACKRFALSLECDVVLSRDSPGFIINRALMPMINEAFYLLETKVATAEDIDKAMVGGLRHSMGPLKLADHIGLDVVLSILQVMKEGFKSERYKPSSLLESLVRQNRLGRKTGKGVYIYS